MKKVILLALMVPNMALGQIVENFEQGNTNNWVQGVTGRWKADTQESLSGSFSLHHIFDNPDAGTDKIGLPVKNLHPSQGKTTWTFIIRHGYDPSSSNNWAVFLMSDAGPESMSPEGATNGYAIGVNISGSDDSLRLVKIKNGSISTVVNCGINWQNNIGIAFPVKIVAERTTEGLWSVSVFRMNGIIIKTSSGIENELFSSSWFGIIYRYSSTRDRLLWIDDVNIEGKFYADNEPPSVVSCNPAGKNSLEIVLSEVPADASVIPENFSLNSSDSRVVSIRKKTATTFILEFSGRFKNKSENKLQISNLCDNLGNCSGGIEVSFTPVWAEAGDVVITEIMADPVPQVSLPGKEYLELTNKSDFPFNLNNWRLSSGDQNYIVNKLTIAPGEVIILCASADTLLFGKYGRVSGLKQFPVLTDEGKIICLKDSTGSLIHGVDYSADWYGDELKKEGGWSLEMIDINYPFTGRSNWGSSVSRSGGTPGKINSIACSNTDISFYGVTNVFPEDSLSILITFSEPVLNLADNIKSIRLGAKGLSGIYPIDPLFRVFSLSPEEQLMKGEIYQVEISGDISDFAGNPPQRKRFSFGLTESVEDGDIMFNELLFNPLPGDPDYIEIFNASEKIIDASHLQFVAVNETGDTSSIYQVSGDKRCILPGSYFTATTMPAKISDRYFSADPENIFTVSNLPSMPDDKGHLLLYNRQLDKIDEVTYSEKMHYSLLTGFEGVSLEKISPLLRSGDAVNWHSATESSGWGTPGAPNSVYTEIPVAKDIVTFSSTKISPDSDGFEDFLTINFRLTGNSNVISVTVFDETGRYVKRIANNLLAGPGATIIWDGTAADGTLVSSGIYIVLINLYDDTGKTNHWKKVCAVVGR